MKKRHYGKMLLLFGAAYMPMMGCGTKENSKMDIKDMTTRDTEFHTELFGGNTYIFSPEDDPKQVAETLDAIYEKQECWVLHTGGRTWRTSDRHKITESAMHRKMACR